MKNAKKTTAVTLTALGRVVPKPRKVPETLPQSALSLRPGKWLSEACAQPEPQEQFIAIRDCWKPVFTTRTATPEEWAKWTAPSYSTVFDNPSDDTRLELEGRA